MATETTTSPAAMMTKAFGAVAERDIATLSSCWDENSHDVFHALDLEARGPAELTAFFEDLWAAVDDFSFEVEAIHEAGDGVAVGQWRLTGNFSGAPFQGIEPTGKAVDIRGCDVMRWDGETLRRNDVYYDGLTFARQIGLLPPADSAADRGLISAFNALTKAKSLLRRS